MIPWRDRAVALPGDGWTKLDPGSIVLTLHSLSAGSDEPKQLWSTSLGTPKSIQHPIATKRIVITTAFCLISCGSSIEDNIDKLGGGPDEQAAGRHELVLASQNAIEPLISALESQDDRIARAEVADTFPGSICEEYVAQWAKKGRYHPPPVSGELSGMNLIRLFRTAEWSQPFVGYDRQEARGFILFQ